MSFLTEFTLESFAVSWIPLGGYLMLALLLGVLIGYVISHVLRSLWED